MAVDTQGRGKLMIVITLPTGEPATYVFRGTNPSKNAARKTALLEAFGCLQAARNLRFIRASWVHDAVVAYGHDGPLISGIEQDHWPEDLKDRLRTNAREIGRAIEDAQKLWTKAGKRFDTFRRIAALYRLHGSRY